MSRIRLNAGRHHTPEMTHSCRLFYFHLLTHAAYLFIVFMTWAECHLWCFPASTCVAGACPPGEFRLFAWYAHHDHKPCYAIYTFYFLDHTVVVDGLTETACTFLPPDMWFRHYCGKTVWFVSYEFIDPMRNRVTDLIWIVSMYL